MDTSDMRPARGGLTGGAFPEEAVPRRPGGVSRAIPSCHPHPASACSTKWPARACVRWTSGRPFPRFGFGLMSAARMTGHHGGIIGTVKDQPINTAPARAPQRRARRDPNRKHDGPVTAADWRGHVAHWAACK